VIRNMVQSVVVAVVIGAGAWAVKGVAASAHASAEAVVEKRFAAVRRHDLEAIVALYAKDAVETSPAFCRDRTGPEGARQTYAELFQAFPNITDDVITYVVDGDHVAVQFVARSRRPDGTFAFEVPLANFLTVRNGRIVRDETYFDTKGRPCS
jgi:ketosteroid isomerase-like protein